MSDNTAAPAKSKKLIIILAVLALVLVAGGAAAWMMLSQRHAAEDEEGGGRAVAQAGTPKTPPTFLPMDNMVVNLADPGGDRFAQLGITLELADGKTADQVKAYMPTIRSGVLLLLSQRTSDELLTREGKEKLAVDIRRGSPTFGQWVGAELSEDNQHQLWVPPGFAHGFVVLSDSADFLYKTTDYYAPEHERCIAWNDPQLAIDWRYAGEPRLSAKDAQGLMLAQAEVFA